MSTHQRIPKDIQRSAHKCAETVLRNLPDDYGDVSMEVNRIALTVLAERQRIEAEVEVILRSALEKGLVSINTTRAVLAAIRGNS